MDEARVSKSGHKRKWLILLIVFVLLGGGAVAFIFIKQPFGSKEPPPIPKIITEQVSFPLYYPVGLPEGYIVGQDVDLDENVVIMNVNPPSGFKIYITQQPVPGGFNYEDFKTTQIEIDSSFSTPLGEAILGVKNQVPVASIFTQQNWILMSTQAEQASKAEFETIIRALKLVNSR